MGLTKRDIDAAIRKAANGTGERRLWDDEVKGLFVRILASRTASFRLQYSMGARGQLRRVTIGRYGSPWTLDTARGEAIQLLKKVEDGEDPARDRAKKRDRVTFQQLAERYLEAPMKPRGKGRKKASSLYNDRALLGLLVAPKRKIKVGADKRHRRTILSVLGPKTPIESITQADIQRLLHDWRDTPFRANRAVSLISRLFNMATRLGCDFNGVNPAKGVDKHAEAPRERYLDPDEIVRLSAALKELQQEDGVTPYGIWAIRLLTFTGARASEILGLTWESIKGGVAELADSKTGKKKLRLSPAALLALKGIPRVKDNPFVIVGRAKGTCLTLAGLEQVWEVVRKRANLQAKDGKNARLHDLRHTFASYAISGGATLAIVGGLLGHTDPKTTARYAHLLPTTLDATAKATGKALTAAMAGKSGTNPQGTANVVAGRFGR